MMREPRLLVWLLAAAVVACVILTAYLVGVALIDVLRAV